MKSLFTFTLVAFFATSLLAISVKDVIKTSATFEQAKETKEEINVKKLPKEVTFDITKNYNGAEILKAYKTYIDGEFTGYLVEAKKGDRKWSITYDEKGNAKNKVTP